MKTTIKKALVIIDIQNDTPKNYKEVIDNINKAIDWAVDNNIHIIYIRCMNDVGLDGNVLIDVLRRINGVAPDAPNFCC